MSDIYVKTNSLNQASAQLMDISGRIERIAEDAGSIVRATRSTISSRLVQYGKATAIQSSISSSARDLKYLSKGLDLVAQYYIKCEKNVLNKSFGKVAKVKSSSTKSKWERFKDSVKEKVVGVSKAVKKTVKNVKSGIKKTAQNLWNGIKKGASKTWNFIKDTAGNIKESFVDIYDYLKASYNENGWVYDVVQYGKAAISIAGSVVAIGTAVASIIGSGGLSTPAAVATIIYGVNGIANGVTDIVNVANDNHDKVGNVNWLKSGLTEGAGWVGEKLGNEDLGEAIGTGIYYVGSLYTVAANLRNVVAKTKQVDGVKFSDAVESAKKLGQEKVSISRLMNTDINQLKYEAALLKKVPEYKALFDYASNAEVYSVALLKSAGFAFKAGDHFDEVLNIATGQDNENPVLDWYDKFTKKDPVYGTYSDVKDTYGGLKNMAENFIDLYKASRLKP